MSSRDEILNKIRLNTRQRFDYPQWAVKATTYADKISQFCDVSRQVGGNAVLWRKRRCVDTSDREA